MDYYHRSPARNSNGAPIFTNAEDRAHELETRHLLENLWNCEIKPFGLLSPVDFFALRDGMLVGVLELKSRSHASTTYSTVFLNVRKWGSLMLYHLGLGCPALFVVRFTDEYRWINVLEIDAITIENGRNEALVKKPYRYRASDLSTCKSMQVIAPTEGVCF
jgi:hypothetical protein